MRRNGASASCRDSPRAIPRLARVPRRGLARLLAGARIPALKRGDRRGGAGLRERQRAEATRVERKGPTTRRVTCTRLLPEAPARCSQRQRDSGSLIDRAPGVELERNVGAADELGFDAGAPQGGDQFALRL